MSTDLPLLPRSSTKFWTILDGTSGSMSGEPVIWNPGLANCGQSCGGATLTSMPGSAFDRLAVRYEAAIHPYRRDQPVVVTVNSIVTP
jgi:hypothetical protein